MCMKNKDLQTIKETIECPCKNNLLQSSTNASVDISENFLTRAEKIWKFYYMDPNATQNPVFCDCFFEKDKEYSWPLEVSAPLKLFLEITWKCNLTCKWCYVPNFSDHDKNPSLEDLKMIVDTASKSWVISMQLLWWEPTTVSFLPELCEYIRSKNIRLEMVSNGFSLSQELIDNIKWYINYCVISIDGWEEIHNAWRGNPKSFEKAKQSFYNLKNAWVNVEILMTVNKSNIYDIEKVASISDNPKDIYLKIMHMSNLMSPELKENCLNKEEIEALDKKAKDMWIWWFQAPVINFAKSHDATFFWCPGGILTWVIDKSWNVYKCLYNRKQKMWNVFEKDIQEIRKENNTERKKSQTEKCIKCEFRSGCWWFCDINSPKCRFI